MEYITATILGGYHNGITLQVYSELKYLKLVEDERKPPLYSEFSTTDEVYIKEHEYRKVDTKYCKSFKRYDSGNSTWLESEDIGLFIPVESSIEYENTLQEIVKKALTVEWTTKYSGTQKGHTK